MNTFTRTFLLFLLCFNVLTGDASANFQKIKLTVLPFDLQGENFATEDMGKIVSEWLITAFVQEGRFEVIERKLLGQILEEQQLVEYGIVNQEAASEIGRLFGVSAIISGSIIKLDDVIEVNARIISVSSGSIITAENARSSHLTGLQDKVVLMAKKIINNFPLKGTVANRDKNKVVINLGQTAGIKEGMQFISYVEDDVAGHSQNNTIHYMKQNNTGIIEVTRVLKEFSEAIILKEENPNGIKYGDLVKSLHFSEKERNIVDMFSVTEWFEKGSVLINAGEYDKAFQAYSNVIELDPNNVSAYVHLGWANNGLEKYQQAIKDLNTALTLDPNNHWAYCNRGWAYNGLGNFQQAQKDLDKAIAAVSDNTWPYTHRGWAHNGLGNYKQAIKDLNTALTLDPNNAIAYIQLGWANNGLGKFQKAIENLDKAVELEPGNKYIYVQKGWSHNGLGNYQQAIMNFNTAIELDPVYTDGYYNLAVFYSYRGDEQKVISFLTTAIKLDENLKVRAKEDASFKAIRNNKKFKKLVY